MTNEPSRRLYRYIDEETQFPHQTSGHRAKQVLPKKDYNPAELARQARHQAREEARQRNRPAAHTNAGITADENYDLADIDGNGDLFPSQMVRSAIRYAPGYHVSNEEVYQQGNKRVHIAYVDIPKQKPPGQQRHEIPARSSRAYREEEQYERETQRPSRTRPKIQLHWLVFAGVSLLLMIAGWIAFTDLGSWWQTHQDDSTYGNPRTYQTDAVVGHEDSSSNPSHFIALNLKGEILVLELPGGNATKARSYPITSLPGNQNNPPVKIIFQDLNHDGKVDMLIQIGDPPNTITFMLFNNGTQFVGKV